MGRWEYNFFLLPLHLLYVYQHQIGGMKQIHFLNMLLEDSLELHQFIIFGYYFINKNEILKLSWKVDILHLLFLTAVSLYMWYLNYDYLFSFIPFVSGFSFVFLIELFKKIDFLNHSLLIRIGKVSYSMYIIHFIFAFQLVSWLSPKLTPFLGSQNLLLILFVIVVWASYLVALLIEKYIEKPCIEYGRKIISNINSTRYINI